MMFFRGINRLVRCLAQVGAKRGLDIDAQAEHAEKLPIPWVVNRRRNLALKALGRTIVLDIADMDLARRMAYRKSSSSACQ